MLEMLLRYPVYHVQLMVLGGQVLIAIVQSCSKTSDTLAVV